jgi:hypothetical protein
VSRPTKAPASATSAATRNEALIPVTDLRPRIPSAAFGGLVFLAIRDGRTEGGGDVAVMLAALQACTAHLGPALAGHWSAAPAR